MGNRLTKIYTKTGDDGTSALADGRRQQKDAAIFMLMGDVDELNAHIGLTHAQLIQQSKQALIDKHKAHVKVQGLATDAVNHLAEELKTIQHLLFNVGGELAMPEFESVTGQHITWLEQRIDAMNAQMPPLKDFILPAGSVLIAQAHVTRAVCRRTERTSVNLLGAIRTELSTFLNRLSDYLFVLARYCGKLTDTPEVLWDKQYTAFDG